MFKKDSQKLKNTSCLYNCQKKKKKHEQVNKTGIITEASFSFAQGSRTRIFNAIDH